MTVWLIQHATNGYVHCTFDSPHAARWWIDMYNSRTTTPGTYTIVERYVYKNPHDIK
jgi:hypothetical protein